MIGNILKKLRTQCDTIPISEYLAAKIEFDMQMQRIMILSGRATEQMIKMQEQIMKVARETGMSTMQALSYYENTVLNK